MASRKKLSERNHSDDMEALSCPNIDRLPLVVNPAGSVEAVAPGSVYQPLLLSNQDPDVEAGPGVLDESEEAFIRDLVLWLYPTGRLAFRDKHPLNWGQKEIWVKRNIEKREESFRIRIEDSDWYYPDFIIWIVDPVEKTQIIGFVDPKGLKLGASRGWEDYKVVCSVYVPHIVEHSLRSPSGIIQSPDGHWSIMLRGALVSTSPYDVLAKESKFEVHKSGGKHVEPSIDDFKRAHIVFQEPSRAYIGQLLNSLVTQTSFDKALFSLVEWWHGKRENSKLQGKHGAFIEKLIADGLTEVEIVGALMRDWDNFEVH